MTLRIGPLVFFILSLSQFISFYFPGKNSVIFSAFTSYAFFCFCLLILKNNFKLFGSGNYLLSFFLCYSVFVFFHGVLISKSYDQWSYLFNVYFPTISLSLFCFYVRSSKAFLSMLKWFLYYAAPIAIFIFLGAGDDRLQNSRLINLLAFIYFILPIAPVLSNKIIVFVLIITMISFFADTNSRSNIIGIVISLLFMLMFYIVRIFSSSSFIYSAYLRFIKYLTFFFMFAPLFFLALGMLGYFNVFKSFDSFGSERNGYVEERTLTTDSRTGVYLDLVGLLNESGGYVIGNSPVVKYKTHLLESDAGYSSGRLGGSESGFIGLYTFGGIIFAGLFFLICARSSYLAVCDSKSMVLKFIGLTISFRWFMIFIESPYFLNLLWIAFFGFIGVAFSKSLRTMSDYDFIALFKRI